MKIKWQGQQVTLHDPKDFPPIDSEEVDRTVSVLVLLNNGRFQVSFATISKWTEEFVWYSADCEYRNINDDVVGWIELPVVTE